MDADDDLGFDEGGNAEQDDVHLMEDSGDESQAESISLSELINAADAGPDSDLEGDNAKDEEDLADASAASAVPRAAAQADDVASADISARGPADRVPAGPRRDPRPTLLASFESWGDLRYNEEAEHIMAVCPLHTNCRRTRTVHPSSTARNPGQGRPIGWLCCWLQLADRFSTAAEHTSQEALKLITLEGRRQARERFMRSEAGRGLARHERARFDHELHDEPVRCLELEQSMS